MEFYLKPNLISKAEWDTVFNTLREEVDPDYGKYPLADLKKQWLDAFEHAILQRVAAAHNSTRRDFPSTALRQSPGLRQGSDVGVFFSGGVDSTFIAFILTKHKIPFTCYTVGFKDVDTKDPEDIIEARKIAHYYGWKQKERIFTTEELEPIIRETVQVLGETANPVTVGVGAVVVAAAKLAKEDGITVLFGGLGSEEIFAGYDRHVKAEKLHEECWNGLFAMYDRDMIRDAKIGAALGISVPTPFMDLEVIRWAMVMPESEKIVGDEKKYILRVIAEEAGLKHEFAFRPKRAAQYGSRMDSALDKLARRKGMQKKEYIESLQ